MGWSRRMLLGAALGTAILPPGIARAGEDATARIAKLRGTASLLRNGAPSELALGDALLIDDRVTTGPNARLKIAFLDGSTLALAASSDLSLDRFIFKANDRSRDAAVTLAKGVLRLVAAKAAPGSAFAVATGTAVAASRSTDWLVSATANGTEVIVIEGEVDVSEAGFDFRSLPTLEQEAKAIRVKPGESITLAATLDGAAPTKSRSDPQRLATLLAQIGDD
jgi:hypothetical protein